MPLNSGGIAGTDIAGILVHGQWRKFGVTDAYNANRKMRCQVDASKKKNCPEEEIRGNGENAKWDSIDGDSADRALHQGNHAGKR